MKITIQTQITFDLNNNISSEYNKNLINECNTFLQNAVTKCIESSPKFHPINSVEIHGYLTDIIE